MSNLYEGGEKAAIKLQPTKKENLFEKNELHLETIPNEFSFEGNQMIILMFFCHF